MTVNVYYFIVVISVWLNLERWLELAGSGGGNWWRHLWLDWYQNELMCNPAIKREDL